MTVYCSVLWYINVMEVICSYVLTTQILVVMWYSLTQCCRPVCPVSLLLIAAATGRRRCRDCCTDPRTRWLLQLIETECDSLHIIRVPQLSSHLMLHKATTLRPTSKNRLPHRHQISLLNLLVRLQGTNPAGSCSPKGWRTGTIFSSPA